MRSGRAGQVGYAVGGYITAAYWFTSSTSFANPAITVGRALTDTFAGIAPASVAMFILMQLLGGALAVGAVALLYPDARHVAHDVAAGSEATSRPAARHPSTRAPGEPAGHDPNVSRSPRS